MRADAEARKVNGIRLKPIKHKKLYGAAARSVVESRLSPSLTLSSKFYEDKNDSKTDSKAKVKPIIQVHGVPVLLSEFEKLASGFWLRVHAARSAAGALGPTVTQPLRPLDTRRRSERLARRGKFWILTPSKPENLGNPWCS